VTEYITEKEREKTVLLFFINMNNYEIIPNVVCAKNLTSVYCLLRGRRYV